MLILNRAELLDPGLSAETRARRAQALDHVERGLAAVDAGVVCAAALDRLGPLDGCTIFAFGKASVSMTRAVLTRVRPRGGVVLGQGPDPGGLGPLRYRTAGHPVPVPNAAEHGAEVLALAQSLTVRDVALCLVSGGGSAMLELPREDKTVADIVRETRHLLREGADIAELNAARRRWSRLKGGRLGEAMAPARVINLVLSDVGGHGPEVVASGPTIVADAQTILIADNSTAVDAIAATGLEIIPGLIHGTARWAGAAFYGGGGGPARVAGGETTVEVLGEGRGGRNQEFVLGAAAAAWAGGLVLSIGTDGVDGTSDAAGALVDEAVMGRARGLGLDLEDHLRRNDTDAFFRRAGGRIVTGPTGTNVADIALFLP
jgi:glycerate-2-kinase